MATTDDLIISLRADVTQLQNSLQQVNQQLNNTQQQGQQANNSLSSGFSQSANKAKMLASAIATATAAVAVFTATTSNAIREFNSLANSLNLTYNQLARLRAVSEGANLETDMMIDLAKTLNEQIGEAANGNKDFEESFSRLGLSMAELTKLGVDEQLITVANALGQVSSQADKAQIGATLFGDNWLPALKLTEVNVKALANEFDNLLPKIDDLDVSRAIEADKEFDKLIANLRTTTEIVSSDLSPAFTVATRNLNALFNVDSSDLENNISVLTFLSIELGAQLINIFTATKGIVEIVSAAIGTLGNIIVMGVAVPVAAVMDVYNTNVAALTNAMIKAENVYNKFKGLPPVDPVPINKTASLNAVMEQVKQTKEFLESFATTGIEDFAAGIGGTAGDAFRDAAIEEASQVKNKNKTGEPTAPKGTGDDGEAAKKADQEAKKLEQLKQAALKELDVISEKNMTEQQLQEKQYNEQIGRLGFYLKSKLITTQQYFDAVQALNQANAKAQMDDELKLFEEQRALAEKQAALDLEVESARLERLNDISKSIMQGGMTELEILDANHAAKLEKLNQLALENIEFQDMVYQLEEEAERQHQSKKLDMILGTGNKIQEMTKAFQKGQLQGAMSFFAADFGGMSQHSRKMFELTKAARLADAAIAIPSTVIEAAREGTKIGGWPLGAAMGAAALASQLANLRQIQAASFGGGASGGGGGVGVGASSASSAEPQQQQPITQRFVNVSVFGEENTMYSRDSVLKLMQRIGEEVKDGAVLRVV